MSRSTFKVFEESRLVFESANSEATQEDRYSFSGPLLRDYEFTLVASTETFWVSCVARSGDCTIILNYETKGSETYNITLGHPLLLQTTYTAAVDEEPEEKLLSVELVRGAPSDVEFILYPAEPPFVWVPPVGFPAVLVLNAASGVELGPDGAVLSWRDVRPNTLAPGAFVPFGAVTTPRYNPSGASFNEKPLVDMRDFDGIPAGLRSEDPASTFAFLVTGPFTVAMICRTDDKGIFSTLVSNHVDTQPGLAVNNDGGHRLNTLLTDELGAPVHDLTEVNEFKVEVTTNNAPATVLVIRYDGDLITTWLNGVQTAANATTTALAAVSQLALGIRPDEAFSGDLILADLRIFDRYVSDSERDSYIEFAQTEYLVDTTTPADAPPGALYMLRVNRGVVNPESNGIEWHDTRPESTFTHMARSPNAGFPTGPDTDSSVGGGRPYLYLDAASSFQYQGAIAEMEFLHVGPFAIVMVYEPRSSDFTNSESVLTLGQDGVSPGIRVLMSADGVFSYLKTEVVSANHVTATIPDLAHEQNGSRWMHLAFTNETDLDLWLDGTPPAAIQDSAFSADPLSGTVVNPLQIGALLPGGNDGFHWQLLEIRFYDHSLAGQEFTDWAAYVAERYGIPS